MKKFITNPAQSYVTPEVEVVEIVSEGVLCASFEGGPATIDPFEEDGFFN